VALQIDEHRAISLAFAQGKIVHAQHGGGTARRQWQLVQEAQQRVPTDPQAKLLAQPRPCCAAKGYRNMLQSAGKPPGTPGPRRDKLWQAFGKNAAFAVLVGAEKLPHAQGEPDTEVCPGEIGYYALIATMDTPGRTLTHGTVSQELCRGDLHYQLGGILVQLTRL
jgi:hypothetical protein